MNKNDSNTHNEQFYDARYMVTNICFRMTKDDYPVINSFAFSMRRR